MTSGRGLDSQWMHEGSIICSWRNACVGVWWTHCPWASAGFVRLLRRCCATGWAGQNEPRWEWRDTPSRAHRLKPDWTVWRKWSWQWTREKHHDRKHSQKAKSWGWKSVLQGHGFDSLGKQELIIFICMQSCNAT